MSGSAYPQKQCPVTKQDCANCNHGCFRQWVTQAPSLPFLDRAEWTTEQALEWALLRVRTSLDCGTYYDKAMSALEKAKGSTVGGTAE